MMHIYTALMTTLYYIVQNTVLGNTHKDMEEEDEFGSFPDGIDFDALDEAIHHRLNSKPQPRVEVVGGSTSNMRNNSTSDIIVIDDSDSDSDEEEVVGKRRGGRRIIVINDSDSDSDEEEVVGSKRRGGRRNVTSSPTATSESVGDAKKNQDDIIIIGETLTSEQLLKRKFDSAVTTGNIIVIDADADAAISNCETFKKRQKVDVDTSPFTQQCQIIISPEKELQQQPQATVQHQVRVHQKIIIVNPYKTNNRVEASNNNKRQGYQTRSGRISKAPPTEAATINRNNINHYQYQNRNRKAKDYTQIKTVESYSTKYHEEKYDKTLASSSSSVNNDNCDCGNPHKKIDGRHICRYFGTFQCPECHKRWKTANCWKGVKQACKRCDVFSFPIRKDKLDGRSSSSKRMGGSGDGHDSNRCGLCRRLGYKSPCF